LLKLAKTRKLSYKLLSLDYRKISEKASLLPSPFLPTSFRRLTRQKLKLEQGSKTQLIIHKTVVSNMKKTFSISILLLLMILLSCKNKLDKESITKKEFPDFNSWRDHWENPTEKAELLSNSKIHKRVKECLNDTSIVVLTSTLIDNLERYSKIKSLGDINKDGINDSILIIPELFITVDNVIEDGASVIFTDKKLPRIRVDSPCMETNYVFPVSDINNDGITELGKYYSSCSSRFKGLELISLNQEKWNIKGQVTFDIFFEEPKKEERIEKIGLNKFRMREITSESVDEKTDIWKIFEMK